MAENGMELWNGIIGYVIVLEKNYRPGNIVDPFVLTTTGIINFQ
jgi:hypothetical protein